MTDRRYEVPDLIPQLRKQNAELMAELKVSREIQAEEKKILLDEIEARAEMRKERDELAAALLEFKDYDSHKRQSYTLYPARYKAILATHDAEVTQAAIEVDFPVIWGQYADKQDEKLAPSGLRLKAALIAVVGKSKWLTIHDAALVKPLLGILERFLPWIEGVNHVHLPGGSVLYSEEVASTLAAYRKTEASLTDAETYECHCGCGYVGTLAAYRRTEVEP